MRHHSIFRLAGVLGLATCGVALFVFGAAHVGQWLQFSLSWMDKAALAVIGIGALLVMYGGTSDGAGGNWFDSDSSGGGDGGGD